MSQHSITNKIAHCGIALSSGCMTLSVGCRAPSVSDLVSKLAERLSTSIDERAVHRYTDKDLFKRDLRTGEVFSPGELTTNAKQHAKSLVLDSLSSFLNDDEWWDEFFGKYVTEQKRLRNNYPIPLEDWDQYFDEFTVEEKHEVKTDLDNFKQQSEVWRDARLTVQAVMNGRGVLYHAEGIAFAYSCFPSTRDIGKTFHRLFANGEMWQSESKSSDDISMSHLYSIVANHRRLDRTVLLGVHDSWNVSKVRSERELDSGEIQFLQKLVSIGVLYGSEE